MAGDNSYKPFAGMSLAMVFTKPSMRTRVSFETVRAVRAALRCAACTVPPISCSCWGKNTQRLVRRCNPPSRQWAPWLVSVCVECSSSVIAV